MLRDAICSKIDSPPAVKRKMFEPLILLSRKQKRKALITNCLSLGTEEYSKNVLPLKSEKMWNHRLDLNKGR